MKAGSSKAEAGECKAGTWRSSLVLGVLRVWSFGSSAGLGEV